MASKTIESSLIIKQLASCNKKTRDKATHLLKTWLPTHPQITNEEMRKIWKGLFYTLWHSDKSQVQLDLINLLAGLIVSLDISLSVEYFDVFLLTIRREWSGIDYLRLDKFYCLIRRFLSNLFVLTRDNKWGVEIVREFMLILEEKTFLSCDKFPAQGVNYHLVGVFLEELKPFLPVNGEVIEVLLKPFVTVLGRSLDKVLLSKIKVCVFGVLLENGEKLLERKRKGEEGVDEVELFGSIALTLGFSKKFFELGSSEECVQGNRKVLFGLHEEFGKLEKDLASSGIEIKVPEVRNEEVSELVPVTQVDVSMDEVSEQQVEVGDKVSIGSTSKLSKKMKKLKKSSGGSVTKKSKKKRDRASSSDHSEVKDGNENGNMLNGENSTDDGGLITLNAAVISNLQMQFEKVAAEVGMDTDDSFAFDLPETPLVATVPKKRKRAKSIGGQVSVCDDLIGQDVNGGSAFGKTAEKSGKKVKFAMKDNLVWKPQSPLPPQSLRLPPSATPRGSALKKGVPAGPVIETPTMVKKVKRRATSLKKARKSLKSVSPSVKRLRKRRALSA